MIETEAKWIREKLLALKPRSILNVGSSTLKFRTVDQPFYGAIFDGFDVVHLDKKDGEGVDWVFDIEMHGTLWHSPFDIILLTSVLEHVNSRGDVMTNILPMVGKHLIVSVPYQWNHHADPIDTGYRAMPLDLMVIMEFFGLEDGQSQILSDPKGKISIGLWTKSHG